MDSFSSQCFRALLVPVIRWGVKHGFGYSYFKKQAKQLFYEAAEEELRKNNIRPSTAALVLLSGLYKGDVDKFKEQPTSEISGAVEPIGFTSQIVARWLALQLPKSLPLKGADGFEGLVAQLNTGGGKVSPRLVLQDMVRRGLARRVDQTVELLSVDGVSTEDAERARVHVVEAVRDHMEACLRNLDVDASNGTKFLEQCLAADDLSSESVDALHAMARVWWMDAVRTIGAEAISLSDKGRGQSVSKPNRLRFGVYFFSEKQSSTKKSGLPL